LHSASCSPGRLTAQPGARRLASGRALTDA
jgi:hypothetical protein